LIPTNSHSPLLRTLIVDDSALLLACLIEILDTQTLVQVVDSAADGCEALRKADLHTPDLVLMDLNMPRMDGLEATALLRSRLPNTRIIIMTLDENVKTKAAAHAHGAHGFIGKGRIVSDLMKEIRRVFRHAASGGPTETECPPLRHLRP